MVIMFNIMTNSTLSIHRQTQKHKLLFRHKKVFLYELRITKKVSVNFDAYGSNSLIGRKIDAYESAMPAADGLFKCCSFTFSAVSFICGKVVCKHLNNFS